MSSAGDLQDPDAVYERSIADPEGFWAEVAGEFDWFEPWTARLLARVPELPLVRGRAGQHHRQRARPARAWPDAPTRSPTSRSARTAASGSSPTASSCGWSTASPTSCAMRASSTGDRVVIYMPALAGGDHRDAGLRPDRRGPLGRLRRASAPARCATGSWTPRRGSSSPPTSATGAARSVQLKAIVDEAVAGLDAVQPVIVWRRETPADRSGPSRASATSTSC